ncbi:DUF3080 family protein [Vibrio sp. OCN044]|uniref:DUF3080 family protein n=1 Tax=Vibrio tetraodonis subsp. pristinus TaxID=2695891 RepID=A0A6L8LS88_9VIBR|nr:DUF3080 family protein [Vibrio tetraodonis]MYM58645.1 DUF3080 family protein [Vibrio tetraodonis subsp. pristinus]
MDQTIETYIARIASIQDRPAYNLPQSQNITLPIKRKLLIDIPTTSIGLLDSYELRKCGLFSLIAERNSILGKVQDQFRNYDYQIALVRGLSTCIKSPNLSKELQSQLTEIHKQKSAELPLHLSNLLYSSEAMRNQLQSSSPLAIDGPRESTIVLKAVQSINKTLSETDQIDSSAEVTFLTPYQETLDKYDVIGQLSYSMLNISQMLPIVTRQLKQYDNLIKCEKNRDRTQFKYLKNIFNKFFIGEVQPYIAKVNSVYYDLEPYLNFAEVGHPEYQYPIKKYHRAFREATLSHVEYWQTLFKRCGSGPNKL